MTRSNTFDVLVSKFIPGLMSNKTTHYLLHYNDFNAPYYKYADNNHYRTVARLEAHIMSIDLDRSTLIQIHLNGEISINIVKMLKDYWKKHLLFKPMKSSIVWLHEINFFLNPIFLRILLHTLGFMAFGVCKYYIKKDN